MDARWHRSAGLHGRVSGIRSITAQRPRPTQYPEDIHSGQDRLMPQGTLIR